MADEQEKPKEEVARKPGISQSLMERIVNQSGQPAMSFDPTTPDGAKKFLQAVLKELPSLKDQLNKKIKITDVFTHDVKRVGPTSGEIEEWQRTVVYDTEGNAYTCGSEGVWKSLEAFMIVRPQMPWNPPIEVEVKLRNLGGGKMWMYLDTELDSLFRNVTKPREKQK